MTLKEFLQGVNNSDSRKELAGTEAYFMSIANEIERHDEAAARKLRAIAFAFGELSKHIEGKYGTTV